MPERIEMLFARMGAAYGHRWSQSYGDPDAAKLGMRVWGDELADLSDSHLDRGWTACMRSTDGWPPTLPEFRQLCLGLGSDGDAIAHALRMDRDHVIARHLIESVTSWDRNHLSGKDLEQRYRQGLDAARQAAERDAITRPALEAP